MRNRVVAVGLIVVALMGMSACKVTRVGVRCNPAEGFARNNTHVLVCQGGRWQRSVTIQQAADAVISTWPGSAVSSVGTTIVQNNPTTLPAQSVQVIARNGQVAANAPIRITVTAKQGWGVADRDPLEYTFTTDAAGNVAVPAITVDPAEAIEVMWYGTHRAPIMRQSVERPGQAASIRVVTGDRQSIVAGQTPAPVVFEVLDDKGNLTGQSDIVVETSNDAAFSVVIDQGRVTVTARKPLTEAGRHYVYVAAEGWIFFGHRGFLTDGAASIFVETGPASDIFTVGGNQSTPVSTEFTHMIGAIATDGYDNPILGTPTFTVEPAHNGAGATLVRRSPYDYSVVANHIEGTYRIRVDVHGITRYIELTNTVAGA